MYFRTGTVMYTVLHILLYVPRKRVSDSLLTGLWFLERKVLMRHFLASFVNCWVLFIWFVLAMYIIIYPLQWGWTYCCTAVHCCNLHSLHLCIVLYCVQSLTKYREMSAYACTVLLTHVYSIVSPLVQCSSSISQRCLLRSNWCCFFTEKAFKLHRWLICTVQYNKEKLLTSQWSFSLFQHVQEITVQQLSRQRVL